MDGACSTYGEVHTGFWWGNMRERAHLIYPGVDGKIIVRSSGRWMWWHGVD